MLTMARQSRFRLSCGPQAMRIRCPSRTSAPMLAHIFSNPDLFLKITPIQAIQGVAPFSLVAVSRPCPLLTFLFWLCSASCTGTCLCARGRWVTVSLVASAPWSVRGCLCRFLFYTVVLASSHWPMYNARMSVSSSLPPSPPQSPCLRPLLVSPVRLCQPASVGDCPLHRHKCSLAGGDPSAH